MAQPTTPHGSAPQQSPTPGVGHAPGTTTQMAPMPAVGEPKPVEPVLFDDIDPVLLVRLHPHAKSNEEARSLEMAQAKETFAASAKTIASQNVPPVVEGREPPPPAAA